MKNGKVAFNPGQLNTNIVRPAGPTDTDVGILFAREPEAKHPFAGLTVFAMHSDTVGGSEYSADYAYYLQQMLRSAYSEDFISAFGGRHVRRSQPYQRKQKRTGQGFRRSPNGSERLSA